MSAPSTSFMKSTNSRRPYPDLPPSYDAAEVEPHGFIDGVPGKQPPFRNPPQPLISGDISSRDLTGNGAELEPLFVDPTTGEPHAAYMAPGDLSVQCVEYGHVEKMKVRPWSVFAAVAFFPFGLLCLMKSRIVYCGRCGLILGSPLMSKDMRRGRHGKHPCCRR